MSEQATEIQSSLPESTQLRLRSQWQAFQDSLGDNDWIQTNLSSHKEELFRVWGLSEYAAKLCVSQPQLLVDLVNSNDLFRRCPDGYHFTTAWRTLNQKPSYSSV